METSPIKQTLNNFEYDENNISYELTSPKAQIYDIADNQSKLYIIKKF
jgi:hypothetical protein